jgi:beta-ribofuranosylaminobenzene 5'-phosphate synthase
LSSASKTMGTGVIVSAPARLHLGFLDLHGGMGRRFGSIGLAISDLKTRLSITPAVRMCVTGPESDRVRAYVETMRSVLGFGGAYDVKVVETIPSHAGLGSGTQLALAVAAGLRTLHGLPLELASDAVRLGRGARSGAGIGLFKQGGLVVDGGRGSGAAPAPLISRLPFPERWRVLVVLDPRRQGLHGIDETEAFAKLPPASAADAAHLCRLLVMKLLPSVGDADLAGFGSALAEFQELIGDYFAPAQGGRRFASADVAATLSVLQHAGAVGIGQSSWGSTGYAFAASAEAADRMVEAARRDLRREGVDILICKALNSGAEIAAHAPADMPDT